MDNKNFLYHVASRTLNLLEQKKARFSKEHTSFYVWPRADRVLLIFDTSVVDTGKINEDFAHRLSTQLQGRLVVRTNSRGLYLQVGYNIPPALVDLTATPLDMSKQPSPYHIPVGTTYSGKDMWINLLEGDSFLLSGSRGMGKTGEVHGWIQALLNGCSVEVYGFDGKRGVEFSRYASHPRFHMVHKLGIALAEMKEIAASRRQQLLKSGQPNLLLYNQKNPDNMMTPIALVVDEAALTNDQEKAALVEIVERERDTGFYPILATNRPEASALLVKSNLVTRVCFPVPSYYASQMVLGMNGAESLPKIQGRGLIVFQAKVTEFQSFRVTYPEPDDETVRMMTEQEGGEEEQKADDGRQIEDRIRELAGQNLSMTAIVRAIWGSGAGEAFAKRSELVKKIISEGA